MKYLLVVLFVFLSLSSARADNTKAEMVLKEYFPSIGMEMHNACKAVMAGKSWIGLDYGIYCGMTLIFSEYSPVWKYLSREEKEDIDKTMKTVEILSINKPTLNPRK